MSPRRRLGAGVDALLSAVPAAEPPPPGLTRVPLAGLKPSPHQPRRRFAAEAIKALAESLRHRGLIQPIVVRPVPGGHELVAGERRVRAARLAGLDSLPALVREMDDAEAAETALVENLQRADLNPIEEARALRRLCELPGRTQQEVADRVGRARPTVANLLRLLELCREVRALVEDGRLSMGHARLLVPLPPARQRAVAAAAVEKGLTVRQTERLLRRRRQPPGGAPPDPDLARLQRELGDRLGCPVELRARRDGGGRVVIGYASAESLQGLLRRLGYEPEPG